MTAVKKGINSPFIKCLSGKKLAKEKRKNVIFTEVP